MQLSGINGDGSVNLTQAASTALLTSFAVPDAYGLVAPIAKPSLLFDETTGWLAIAGNANNNIVKQTITNKGSGNGGNVAIASLGNVKSGNITTLSNAGNAGYIKITAGSLTELDKNIKVGNLDARSTATFGGVAKTGGVISLKASANIEFGYISSTSTNGNAGNITLNSANGSINTSISRSSTDINGGYVSATSFAGGNAGVVSISAAKDIKTGDIFTRSRDGEVATTGGVYSGVWNGGRVTLDAGGNIETGFIKTTSITGNAGIVKITADGDILTGAIASNTFDGSGKGGNISLTSDRGNIEIDYARSDSTGGKAGNITLDAGGINNINNTVRVTDTFQIAIDAFNFNYSLFASGKDRKNGEIIISHGAGFSGTNFTIGDASKNGTAGFIRSGFDILAEGLSLSSGYTLGKINVESNFRQISSGYAITLPISEPLLKLSALIYAEASATNGGNFLERIAIGAVVYNRTSLIQGVGSGSESLTNQAKEESQLNAIRDFVSTSPPPELVDPVSQTPRKNLGFTTVLNYVVSNRSQYDYDPNRYQPFLSGVLQDPFEQQAANDAINAAYLTISTLGLFAAYYNSIDPKFYLYQASDRNLLKNNLQNRVITEIGGNYFSYRSYLYPYP